MTAALRGAALVLTLFLPACRGYLAPVAAGSRAERQARIDDELAAHRAEASSSALGRARADLVCAEVDVTSLDFTAYPDADRAEAGETSWRFRANGCGQSARYDVECRSQLAGARCEPRLMYLESGSKRDGGA